MEEQSIKILVVDDDPDTLDIIRIGLEFRSYRVISATNGLEAIERASSENPDLIIMDVMMPKMDGLQACMHIKENFFTSTIPVILLTARGQIEDKVYGLSMGADDYMAKPFDMRELSARVEMILRRTRISLEANPLTGLPGNVSLHREIQKRIEGGEKFAVCYMDLDNFKAYNDRYGHTAGDRVIKMTAEILTLTVLETGKESDFIGHIGGDDFILVTVPDRAEALADEVVKRFDAKIMDFYSEKDKKQGYIDGFDRQGKLQRFPLTSISIGIISNEKRSVIHPGQVAQIAAELKKYAKTFEGSIVVKDRRRGEDHIPLEASDGSPGDNGGPSEEE